MLLDESIVVTTAERTFADLVSSQEIIHAMIEAWTEPLWQAWTNAGLPLAWVLEAHGGSDALEAQAEEGL